MSDKVSWKIELVNKRVLFKRKLRTSVSEAMIIEFSESMKYVKLKPTNTWASWFETEGYEIVEILPEREDNYDAKAHSAMYPGM